MNKEQELDKLYELFVWSDDKRELEDAVTELIEFDDDLRDILYQLVIKSVGTNGLMENQLARLYSQANKTAKNYAAFKAESNDE